MALMVGAECLDGGQTLGQGLDQVGSNAAWEGDLQFEAPYGASTPSIYAQFACRYMHETGTTSEMCAHASVENRRWALHHPI